MYFILLTDSLNGPDSHWRGHERFHDHAARLQNDTPVVAWRGADFPPLLSHGGCPRYFI